MAATPEAIRYEIPNGDTELFGVRPLETAATLTPLTVQKAANGAQYFQGVGQDITSAEYGQVRQTAPAPAAAALTADLPKNGPDPVVEALVNAKDAKGIEALQRKLVATGHYPQLAKALEKGDGGHFGILTKLALQHYLTNNPRNDATNALIVEGAQGALKELNVDCPPKGRNPRVFLIQAANDLVINPTGTIGMDGLVGDKTRALITDASFKAKLYAAVTKNNSASAPAPATQLAPAATTSHQVGGASIRSMREGGPTTAAPPTTQPAAASPESHWYDARTWRFPW